MTDSEALYKRYIDASRELLVFIPYVDGGQWAAFFYVDGNMSIARRFKGKGEMVESLLWHIDSLSSDDRILISSKADLEYIVHPGDGWHKIVVEALAERILLGKDI